MQKYPLDPGKVKHVRETVKQRNQQGIEERGVGGGGGGGGGMGREHKERESQNWETKLVTEERRG